MSLENLEDRRLLSAVLVSDPILEALTSHKPPTADVAIVQGHLSPVVGNAARDGDTAPAPIAGATAGQGTQNLGPDAGGILLAAIPLRNPSNDQPSDTGHDPVVNDLGSILASLEPSGQPEGIGSLSILDTTFVAGNLLGVGRVQPTGTAEAGSEGLNTGASLANADNSLLGGDAVTGGGPSSTTSGDSQVGSIVPANAGNAATLIPAQSVSFLVPSMTAVGDVVIDPRSGQGDQTSSGTGDLSGGDLGSSSTDSSSGTNLGTTIGELAQGVPDPVEVGVRKLPSDGGDQDTTSDGTSGDNTGAALDDGSTSSADDGQSVGNSNTRGGHAQSSDQADSDSQVAAGDVASSSGPGHHSGAHSGRGRGGSGQGAGDPAEEGPAMADASADLATDAATSFSFTAGPGQDFTSSQVSAADPAGVSMAVDPTGETTASSAAARGHHHHHRFGPFFVPTIDAADLNYAATDWGQASDNGMGGSGDYFQQNYDFTTKATGLANFRPDGLARAEKAPVSVEKTDWRYLGSQIRGTNGTPVLIGWGNSGTALSAGEGIAEGLDLVYSFQASAPTRGSGVTGFHHVPARASNRQDLGLADRGLMLAESANFFAARSLPPAEASHTPGRGFWQVAAATAAEVDQEPIEHLVAGSFAARHLNSDGDSSGDSQRLDGRGWWGIVAQFILAPQFPHNHQPTIMLAVADEPSRDALNVALVKANFLVLTAATAREAMKLLRTPLSPVDVALLDVHLPDVNGVDLCSRLRELYPTLPVLVCTDQAEHGDVNQLQKLNVLRIFSKPVAIGELLAAVKGIVS